MATHIKRSKSLAASFERRTMCRLDVRTMASGEPNWPTPMKAIGAQNLLTMPGGVTISGYLHKRGAKQFQLLKWPLRFVIIHKGCVYYFKTSTSASSQGAFSLNGYNRVMRAAEETTSSNVFPFKMVHISKKQRTWYFSAASEDERKKWMLSLRKEIDHYHEKKETVTDLSDDDSDTDSFYGSVERPVDIKYTQNPADDSLQDDDDDEEEEEDDYVQPDGVDESAPAYPPPPVPRLIKSEEEPKKRRSMPGNGLMTKQPLPSLPIPAPKKPLPGLPEIKEFNHTRIRMESTNSVCDKGVKIPPIPKSPAAYKINEFIPPRPQKKSSTEVTEREPPHPGKELFFVPNYDLCGPGAKPPPVPEQPPAHQTDPPAMPPTAHPRKGFSNSETKSMNVSTQKLCDNMKNSLSRELNTKLKTQILSKPPPTPPTKPSPERFLSSPPCPPEKPSIYPSISKLDKAASQMAPEPPAKPKTIGVSSEGTFDGAPAGPPKACNIQKPPPLPKLPGRKSVSDKPVPSPIVRSPPDGQSFRSFPVETPVRPLKQKPSIDSKSDSDSDYEKVPLPASVFVDTTDSADVERIFKASSSGGSPPNGLFCIRNSTKTGKVLVVWDKLAEKLRNYRIFEKRSEVYLEGDIMFPDIGSLVEHYYENKLPSHNNLLLQHAYGCSTPR
ncbi:SH3 domain-binding protein 2 [Rhinophrynus dorsalis]